MTEPTIPPVDPLEPAPAESDNRTRPEDGEQNVTQEPNLVEEK